MLQPAAIATSRLPALRVVAVWFGRRRMVRQRRVSAARPVDLSRPPTTKAAFSLSPGPVYCSLMWPGLWRLSAALSSPTRSGSAGASPTALCRRSALSKGRRHARRRDDGPGPGLCAPLAGLGAADRGGPAALQLCQPERHQHGDAQ